MTTAVRATDVGASPERVWAVLADFGALARWAPEVEHSSLSTDGPVGPGSIRRVQVGRTALLERITEWEPGEALAYAIEGLPPVVRSVMNRWTLEDAAPGGTRVTLTTEIDTGPRPPQRLVGRAVARRMARASESMLDGLAAEVGRREGAET